MKIEAIINGKSRFINIPTSWQETTFKQFVDLEGIDSSDKVLMLEALTGIKKKVWLRSRVVNFDLVERLLNYLSKRLDTTMPKTILGYQVPKDLKVEELGRYEDARLVASTFDEKKIKEYLNRFPEIVSIFVMPNYLDATETQKDQFAKRFFDAPCGEVMAIGNFYLYKLMQSKLNTDLNLFKSNTLLRRLMLVFRTFRARLGFSVRYWLWKRKHHLTDMNS